MAHRRTDYVPPLCLVGTILACVVFGIALSAIALIVVAACILYALISLIFAKRSRVKLPKL